jgi:hypothetical protein
MRTYIKNIISLHFHEIRQRAWYCVYEKDAIFTAGGGNYATV